MVIAAVVLLVVAAVCGFFAWYFKLKERALVTTETLTVQELGALCAAASSAAGPGVFRHRCEVVGMTQSGPAGPLRSELAHAEGVWHRHVVTRKYWVTQRDGKGNSRRVDREEQMAERVSEQPFVVGDATGSVVVYPENIRPEGAQKVLDRFEQDQDRADRGEIRIGSFAMALPNLSGSGTYGYRYEEWVLGPGARVFVAGEASDARGELGIDRTSVISTRSEAELLARERNRQRWSTVAAAVLALAGVVLLVVGVLR